jgi:uncharacterized protein YcfJ
MNTVSKTLIAGAITAAMVLPASGAFAGEKTNKAILGAVIGGIAGAALGDGNKNAVAIGAVAGAAIGASTAKNNNDRRYSSGYQTRPAYNSYGNGYGAGHGNSYNNGYQTNHYGRQTDSRYYGRNDRNDRNDRYDARYDRDYRR